MKSWQCSTRHGKQDCPSGTPRGSPWISIRDVVELLEGMWREPDEGIWEVRGQRQHFTYSKVSAWTAVDRAIKYAEGTGADVPLDRWRALRDEIHAYVSAKGYDAERNTFVQYYGGKRMEREVLAAHSNLWLPPAERPTRPGNHRCDPDGDL